MIAPLLPDHGDACVAIVQSLPEWFGYESALADVARAAATQEGFVAIDGDEVVGFIALSSVFEETLEITHLAVQRHRRGKGWGRQLVRAAKEKASVSGAEAICLLTLGPSANSPHYAETVAFYRAIGFWRTKESRLSDWGGAPALLMSAPLSRLNVD